MNLMLQGKKSQDFVYLDILVPIQRLLTEVSDVLFAVQSSSVESLVENACWDI